jgi:hypothetical protein
MSATARNSVGTAIGSLLTEKGGVAVGAFLAGYSGNTGSAKPRTYASSRPAATIAKSAFSRCAARRPVMSGCVTRHVRSSSTMEF